MKDIIFLPFFLILLFVSITLAQNKQEANPDSVNIAQTDSLKKVKEEAVVKAKEVEKQKQKTADSLKVVKQQDEMRKLALSPLETNEFKKLAQYQLQIFADNLNKLLNKETSAEVVYEVLHKKIFDSQPFFGDEKAIDPDVEGNYEISLKNYLQLLSNSSENSYRLSNILIDSIFHSVHLPDSIFPNKIKQPFYFTRIIHNSNLSKIKREAFAGFYKNQDTQQWECRLFFILFNNPKKDLSKYRVPTRKLEIKAPKSLQDTTDFYSAKNFWVIWSDSLVGNGLAKNMLSNLKVITHENHVSIDLYWRGLLQKNIVHSAINNGKFHVQNLQGIPTDNAYNIKITSLQNPLLRITSKTFGLDGDSTAKRIKIISLEAKQDTNVVCVGDTLQLKIETTPNIKYLKIIYYKKNKKGEFVFKHNIAHDNLKNTTDYIEWIIGKEGSGTFKVGEEIRIVVQDAHNQNIKAESEKIFIISKKSKTPPK